MNSNLVVIGDSHAYRMARTSSFVFPLPAICKGVPGETADQVYYRFQSDCLDYDPACVIVLCGTNSVIRNGTTDAHRAWACGDDARLAGAKVVLVKIPPCGDWSNPAYFYHTSPEGNAAIQAWNASIASYAATLNAATPGCCEVADLFTPFLNGDGSINSSLFLDDLTHFGVPDGNEVAAKILRQCVLDLFD